MFANFFTVNLSFVANLIVHKMNTNADRALSSLFHFLSQNDSKHNQVVSERPAEITQLRIRIQFGDRKSKLDFTIVRSVRDSHTTFAHVICRKTKI